MSDCIPCQKNKLYSKQFNDKGQIVERSLIEKTISFAGAMVEEATPCPKDEQKKRLLICSFCDFLNRFNQLPKGADVSNKDTCIICGCYLFKKSAQIGKKWNCPLIFWDFKNFNEFNQALADFEKNKSEKVKGEILSFIIKKTENEIKEIDNPLTKLVQEVINIKGGADFEELTQFFNKSILPFYLASLIKDGKIYYNSTNKFYPVE